MSNITDIGYIEDISTDLSDIFILAYFDINSKQNGDEAVGRRVLLDHFFVVVTVSRIPWWMTCNWSRLSDAGEYRVENNATFILPTV